MGKPSLEEFRRWLQSEIRELESLDDGQNIAKRLLQLEMALQESMAFTAAWEIRSESEITPVIQEKSVRLISASPDAEPKSHAVGSVCSACDAEIDEDLPFCPTCGVNR
jgi:hypothetical protein